MKASIQKPAPTSRPVVLQKEPHPVRPVTKATTPVPKAKKRDNIFSKSRDIREDRGSRQMKMSHNPQTLPHGQ